MIPFRLELRPFLEEFADSHRGVRLGKMFGWPGLYAGRRLFACVSDDGLVVKLPIDIARREIRDGARPFSQGPATPRSRQRSPRTSSWVVYRPRSIVAARRLVPILEVAARDVARQQVEDMTGVRLRQK
jgi:hypothetical protein